MSSAPVEIKKGQPRDPHGRFDSHDPPLVNVTVTNPFTYLKLWWQKVVNNEGIDLRLRVRPLTALTIAAAFTIGGFGLGRLSVPIPQTVIKYIPQLAPTPTPNPYKDLAFAGTLRFSETTKKFYLQTDQGVITLEVPQNINLSKYIGRRIFAAGQLHTATGILKVLDASDLELLPTTISPIPTIPPTTVAPKDL